SFGDLTRHIVKALAVADPPTAASIMDIDPFVHGLASVRSLTHTATGSQAVEDGEILDMAQNLTQGRFCKKPGFWAFCLSLAQNLTRAYGSKFDPGLAQFLTRDSVSENVAPFQRLKSRVAGLPLHGSSVRRHCVAMPRPSAPRNPP